MAAVFLARRCMELLAEILGLENRRISISVRPLPSSFQFFPCLSPDYLKVGGWGPADRVAGIPQGRSEIDLRRIPSGKIVGASR